MAFESLPHEKDIEALVGLLAWLEDQVRTMIEALLAREPQGAGALLWVRKRAALLDAMILDVQRQVDREMPTIFDDAYRYGMQMGGVSGVFGAGMQRRALELLAHNLRDDVDANTAELGRRAKDLFRQLTLKQVALHIVAGTGAKAEAKTLERALIRRGTRAFVDRAGREWSLRNWAEMAIPTTAREAVTQGAVLGLEKSGHDLCKISHHEGSCDICLPYDGKTFALPGHEVSGYRTLDKGELPPFHPRCKHVMTASHVGFNQLEADLLEWDRQRKAQHA